MIGEFLYSNIDWYRVQGRRVGQTHNIFQTASDQSTEIILLSW